MKVAGNYQFDAPRQIVWETLQDPDVLGKVMPGGQELEKIGDDQYKATLKVKVGPVQGVFKGSVLMSDIVEPESYNMLVEGRGQPGFVKGSGAVTLTEDGGKTTMSYTGDAQVGGRLASVGQRLMDSAAKAMIKQSLDGINEYVKLRVAPPPTQTVVETPPPTGANGKAQLSASPPTPQIEIKQPTQAEFALGVAKNMLDEAVPAEQQPILLLGVGFFMGLIIGLLLNRK